MHHDHVCRFTRNLLGVIKEHVGSLLRPKPLLEKRRLFKAQECSAEELELAANDAVKQVVQLQYDLGIKTITDGEQRRTYFFDGVFENLEGMTFIPNRPIHTFKQYIPHVAILHGGATEAPTIYCTGKIKRTKPFYVKEFKSLKSVVRPEDVKHIKITMCSPSWFHQRHGSDFTYDQSVYKTDDEYFDDLGIAYRAEIAELYALGCRHIQFDDPTLCYFCSESMLSGMEQAGVDHQELLDTYIRSINVCVQDRPTDLQVGVHMCRGNLKGMHFSEGGYGRVAEKVFKDLDVDTYYLEYDTERAGDFSPLKHLPPGKVVVLGLVTTKNGKMETISELKARVEEAANVIAQGNPPRSFAEALNQICISPQCGFASTWEGNPITEEVQRAKLALIVEAAKAIWGE